MFAVQEAHNIELYAGVFHIISSNIRIRAVGSYGAGIKSEVRFKIF
jgi:hypothetical protein